MKKKKLLTALIVGTLACLASATLFTACGGKKDGEISTPPVSSTEPSPEETPYYSEGLSYRLNNQSYTVYGLGLCTDSDIVIPDTYNGLPVTGIYSYAFDNETIESVVIPDSITSIGYGAFYSCDFLTEVTIPNSIISIEPFAFYNCDKLTEISIPDGVTSIEPYTFYGCSSLISVQLGNDVTSIGNYAFSGCFDLTEINIPSSLSCIGVAAFNNCDSLTEISIPDLVTTIGESAFYNCDSLTSAIIGNGVESIGKFAFYNCDSLTKVIIGDGVTSIGDEAFFSCNSLNCVTLGESVADIGSNTFYNCYTLVEVVNKSTNINITAGDTSNGYIGHYALAVYNNGDTFTTKLFNDNGYIVYADDNEKILVSYNGKETDLAFPSYITQIYHYAFYNCRNLTNVVIGDLITNIDNKTFSICTNLTSLTIGSGVTSIAQGALSACISLQNITVSENNKMYKSIDGNLYSKDGTTLIQYAIGKTETSFNSPDGITTIGEYAFHYCVNLRNVTIGDGVTTIGRFAFNNCSNLTEILIPESVSVIDIAAFQDCANLTIYCEAESQPEGWHENWRYSSSKVEWGYTGIDE